MENKNMTKDQLIMELRKSRQRIAQLEIFETRYKQSEEKRNVALKMVAGMIENIPVGVSIHDMTGRIIDINRALTDLLGYTKEELIGKTPLEVFKGKGEQAKALQALIMLFNGEPIHNAEFQVVHKDGSVFLALVDVSVLNDSAGNPLSTVIVFEDITERKYMEQRLNERELLILQLIANGSNTKEIGAHLFLSENTIKRDVRIICEKFGVRSRSEALVEAYKRNLI